ncbi:hypothetical protein B0J13DRAFT_539462 [Dactylonectria estremocensis]|uniref:Uncharacterized protein n=1 Tax=Dactylonectria estremocensis TaxID=1079267 RepID=A0A9P9FD71_9HYPO|nr:hypothetical protein B0J13DRAFT_539462 [Dactylonectria estremocensis]
MATIPQNITLTLPSKYASSPPEASSAPGLDWLTASWTVTHSTLSMWRSARNVRITYKPLPANSSGSARLDDLVEYEPLGKEGVLKSVAGVDTQASGGKAGWDWRGKGMLVLITSHWEVLGWGEATTAEGIRERWAVTWFAPTLFTSEGLDVYCDRKEGLSPETYAAIREALEALEAAALVGMVEKDMKPVEIRLPWVEA